MSPWAQGVLFLTAAWIVWASMPPLMRAGILIGALLVAFYPNAHSTVHLRCRGAVVTFIVPGAWRLAVPRDWPRWCYPSPVPVHDVPVTSL